jgi:mono/diheme cytochrome c family protein
MLRRLCGRLARPVALGVLLLAAATGPAQQRAEERVKTNEQAPLVKPVGPAQEGAGASSGSPVDEELVAIGRRLYREGLLASGQPVEATVQGDVPVDGTQFTCVSCHRRAGMGAIEADRVVAPVSGQELYRPRESGYEPRPAYTDETLARVLREGIDPAGRAMDPLMPLYELPDREMAGLIAYLKTLSAEFSPGVTDEEIRFATVIAGDVDPALEKAMLDVLETFFDEKNRRTRHEVRRLEAGPWIRDYKYKAYRFWVFEPWRLKGPPQTWPAQLEEHYERRPAFALVSGVAAGDWRPIHDFCERRQIPCLLPNTDWPVTSGDDYYTMYFSKGLTLEAQAITRHLSEQPAAVRTLHVFREDGSGSAAARASRLAAREHESVSTVDWVLAPRERLSAHRLDERLDESGANAAMLWLGQEDLAELGPGFELGSGARIYLSSTLLDGDVSALPDTMRARSSAVHPYTLPEELKSRAGRVRGWLRSRKIDGPHERVRAQTYFACMMVGDALGHIKRYFYRDYFMDSLEHADRMAVYSAFYPRLSFGPGQRYLAKGCYVVPLGGDREQAPSARTSWVVP